ncbi:hypothetical protein [Paracoccus thiocyanatus]|uniref:Uncharacterized protein n=1 Tax=Paracoccus thiocyanatus TaxID=34006 RepID=A0A1N6PZW9_9RHOB|nr:hypothetical protein [Paracoccus thiocyanatus]RDW12519.1 hypothetical protein DIE28_13210 [Paracoccus thiocyanatus]SIQ09759.1 hypothetical protein SAMN05421641_103240 [Paracoccus thiocyanatus]
MAKSSLTRVTDKAAPPRPRKPDPATEQVVERLRRTRSANEITSVIGLKPIRGRSGPKIAY